MKTKLFKCFKATFQSLTILPRFGSHFFASVKIKALMFSMLLLGPFQKADAQACQFVANGDFGLGQANWTGWSSPGWSVVSGRAVNATDNTDNFPNQTIGQTLNGLQPGNLTLSMTLGAANYAVGSTVRVWLDGVVYATFNNPTGSSVVSATMGNGATINGFALTAGNAAYVDDAFTITIPYSGPSNASLAFQFFSNGGSGDDFRIENITLTGSCPYKVSGKLFNDLNSNTLIDGSEFGTSITKNFYVYLVNSSNLIVDSAKVAANGTYSLGTLQTGNYTIELSTVQYALYNNVVTTPISNTMPAGWISTGENGAGNTGTGDGTANGVLSVNVNTASVTQQNFGIRNNQLPFTCNTLIYQVASPTVGGNSTLYSYDINSGIRTTVAALGYDANAIGYNSIDNTIWGADEINGVLVRIGANGGSSSYTIPNLPTTVDFNNGTVMDGGYFLLSNTALLSYYVVDVNPSRSTYLQLVDPLNGFALDVAPYGTTLSSVAYVNDWAYNTTTGMLYGMCSPSTTNQYKIATLNPLTGNVTYSSALVSGAGIQTETDAFGSVFTDPDGDYLYVFANGLGRYYKVNLSSYTATLLSQSIPSRNNDGANCTAVQLTVDISGKVFNDVNSNTLIDGTEEGTTARTKLYVYLLNGSNIVDSAEVALNGSYSLNATPNTNYTLKLSTAQYTIGTSPTVITTAPAGWVNTGENGAGNTGSGDGTANGILTVNVGTANVTQQNFGLKTTLVPFPCNSLEVYQVTSATTSGNSTLWKYNPILGTRVSMGVLPGYINAIGYNATDNYIWGSTSGGNIAVIGSNGQWIEYDIPNLATGTLNTGTISPDGYMYLYTSGGARYYVIDLNPTRTATYLQLVDPTLGFVLDNTSPYGTAASPSRGISDWAYNPIDGQLYAVTNSDQASPHRVMTMNPHTGVTTLSSIVVNGGGFPGSDYGGAYFDAQGNFYVLKNSSGHFYRINLATYAATKISTYSVTGVEFNDAAACITAPPLVDLGDAPDTYGTYFNSDGAAHIATNNLKLGLLIDAELDGQPNALANGDNNTGSDDEDGLSTIPSISLATTNYQLNINLTNTSGGTSTLAGWIDFDRNGTFDNDEKAQVNVSNGATSATLIWNSFPGITVGTSYIRLRISTDVIAVATAKGTASDGEVEDYSIAIVSSTVILSGSVLNDANGLTDMLVNGTSPNLAGLHANLLDGAGNVVATVPVDQTLGTYTFPNVIPGTYTVQLNTVPGTLTQPAPTVAMPSGWVNTGDVIPTGAAENATQSVSAPITVGTSDVADVNFAIQQPPVAVDDESNNNTIGTDVTVNPLTNDSDPSVGGNLDEETVSLIASSVPGASCTSTDAQGECLQVTVPNEGVWTVDPMTGAVTFNPDPTFTGDPTPIDYTVDDNAGSPSNPATITITFNDPVNLSGSVLNDVNGLTDMLVNGTSPNLAGLHANLLDGSGNVVATVPVDQTLGTYSFPNVIPGTYTVQLNTVAGTPTQPAPTVVMPSGWVNTGDVIPTGTAENATQSVSAPITVGASNVSGVNFGIQQPPLAVDDESNNNTIGTDVTVNPLTNDSDPSVGGSLDPTSVSLIAISIPGSSCTSTDAQGDCLQVTVPNEGVWTVDPMTGAVTFNPDPTFTGDPTPISYTVDDNAGLPSNPATITITYCALEIGGTVFIGNVITDGVNGTPLDGSIYDLYVTMWNGPTKVGVKKIAANGTYSFTNVAAGTYKLVLGNDAAGSSFAPSAVALTTYSIVGEGGPVISNIAQGDGIVDGKTTITVDCDNIVYENNNRVVAVNNYLHNDFELKNVMALPVDLITFYAKQFDEKINLTWKIANEKNFSHFEVLISGNAKEFGSLGKVIGSNQSFYGYTDSQPIEGINYYQLKMIDLDGTSKLSKVISVNFEKGSSFIAVENPAINGDFKIITNLNNPTFRLFNSLGREINIEITKQSDNLFNIKAINKTPGMYYLNTISDGKLVTKKVLIP